MFNGQYLTYLEYQSLGGTLEETPFNLLEFEARKQIDLRTQNRLKDVDTIPNEVKLCDYHLIDKIMSFANTIQTASQNNVKQENIDGYSVTYITPAEINNIVSSKNYDLQDIMMNDLYGVIVNNEHIIYNGAK